MTAKATGDRRATHAGSFGNPHRSGPLRVVMLGAPGAGKGTQADRFARQRGVLRISTGDILREAVLSKSETGRTVRSAMVTGRLVGDDIVIEIVRDRIAKADAAAGFVLDGFPRTLAQAEALDALVDARADLVVVAIEVPEETLIDRLAARRVCRACGTPATPPETDCSKCGGALVHRHDDDREIVRERLGVYEHDTRPIVEFYRRRSTFRSVDGDQLQDAVAADIAAAVASVVGART